MAAAPCRLAPGAIDFYSFRFEAWSPMVAGPCRLAPGAIDFLLFLLQSVEFGGCWTARSSTECGCL